MRARTIVVALLIAAAVAAVAWLVWPRGEPPPQPTAVAGSAASHGTRARPVATPTMVSGRVSRRDGRAIGGATVALAQVARVRGFGDGQEPPSIATTDATGAWSVKVPPGDYAASATAAGFVPAQQGRVAVAAGEARTGVDFILDAGGTSVRGTVSDVGGGAIVGARVTARSRHAWQTTREDAPAVAVAGADGRYELSLADGAYNLTAERDDYAAANRDVVVAGKPVTADFALIPGAAIAGEVIARDTGKPVPRAAVHVDGRGRAHRGRDVVADDDGKFALHSLPAGAARLEATGDGYASNAPTIVELGIGEQVVGVRVVVDHALSISGRAVDPADRAGVAGAQITAWAMGAEAQLAAPEPTGSDGAFTIPGVKPGSYLLFATADDKMPALGKSVEVVDKPVDGVVIEVGVGATLTGRVDPAAVASISVAPAGDVGIANLMDVFRVAFVHADSDATGAFVLHHVPDGKLVLEARTADGPAGKLEVSVAGADQANLVIPLETRASIAGHVIDSNGSAVAGVPVQAREVEGGRMAAVMLGALGREAPTTQSDGAFKIVGLEAGTYTVDVDDPDTLVERMTGSGTHPVERVELAAGAERTGVIVTVDAKDGVLRGTVVGDGGAAIPDAWVTAYRSLPDVAKSVGFIDFNATPPVLTGADGTFEIGHLRKGKYHLVADGPSGASHGEQDGATGDAVTITLAALGTLSGHVTAAGTTVPAYDLTCTGTSTSVDRHIDSADGAYLIEHLVPGSYTCMADSEVGTANAVVVVPTGPATLDLQIASWATLTGTVVSVLGGRPVPGVLTIAYGGGNNGRVVVGALMGSAPSTDANGRFEIDRVAAGSGSVVVMAKSNMQSLGTQAYTAAAGQATDLGAIKVVPPPTGDAGTLGMATDLEATDLAVTLVQAGGPAASAGVVVGDKITAIQGTPVAELTPFVAQQLVSSGTVGAGETLQLTLARGATVSVTAAKW